MKITKVTTHLLTTRWTDDAFFPAFNRLLTGPCTNDPFLREARKRRSVAFMEVFYGRPDHRPGRISIVPAFSPL